MITTRRHGDPATRPTPTSHRLPTEAHSESRPGRPNQTGASLVRLNDSVVNEMVDNESVEQGLTNREILYQPLGERRRLLRAVPDHLAGTAHHRRICAAPVASPVDGGAGEADRRPHGVLSRASGGAREDRASRLPLRDRPLATIDHRRDRGACAHGRSCRIPSSGDSSNAAQCSWKGAYTAAERLYSIYYKEDEAAVVRNFHFMAVFYNETELDPEEAMQCGHLGESSIASPQIRVFPGAAWQDTEHASDQAAATGYDWAKQLVGELRAAADGGDFEKAIEIADRLSLPGPPVRLESKNRLSRTQREGRRTCQLGQLQSCNGDLGRSNRPLWRPRCTGVPVASRVRVGQQDACVRAAR